MIYLDHAATTPLRPGVLEAMQPFLSATYGNPSSLHTAGRTARKAIRAARAQIADVLGIADPEHIVITGSATEANNMALKGIAWGLRKRGRHLITTAIEHAAVLEPCAWLQTQGWSITFLPVDCEGRVDPADLAAALRPDTVLVSIMHGNNEVGTLQDIATLGHIARDHGVLFHTDAVQTVGKLPLVLRDLPVDLLSASAHKFYGPKGVGFLVAHEAAQAVLTPLLHGGGQQNNLRSGTDNVAGIVGMAEALALSVSHQAEEMAHAWFLQQHLLEGLQSMVPSAPLHGPRHGINRVPGNVNVSFPPLEGEALVLRFDLAGIAVSSGSACHSRQLTGSHVLAAMGASPEVARSSIRFSIGYANTLAEMDQVLAGLPDLLDRAGYAPTAPIPA